MVLVRNIKSFFLGAEHILRISESDDSDYEALTGSTETESEGMDEPPSLEEVTEVIDKKHNKAPYPDAIPSELLKNGGKETSKFSALVENTVGDYQNGFRKRRFTTEQIFNIRQIMEKTNEFGINSHHLFIDFKSAYDNIMAALKEFKIPDKLLRLKSLTLNETKIMIRSSTYSQSPEWTEEEIIAFQTLQFEAEAEYKKKSLYQVTPEERGSGKMQLNIYGPEWIEDQLLALQISQCEAEAECRQKFLNQVTLEERGFPKEAKAEYKKKKFLYQVTPEERGSGKSRSFIPVISAEWKAKRLAELKREENIKKWSVPITSNKIDKGKEMDFGIRGITVTPKQCITKEKWEQLPKTLIPEISPNWKGKENESTEEVVVNC
ncbi:reverse transcriptase domain-containing protein [Trichonephila clavipes]|nr:reverse transcriptase domain-containing protein [Trichonephila clavipes]